jgi:hypothetical protein
VWGRGAGADDDEKGVVSEEYFYCYILKQVQRLVHGE